MAFLVLKVRMLKSQRFSIENSLAITAGAARFLEKGFTFPRITKIPF